MKIVAFLQNQWFPEKNLAGIKRAYERHPTPEGRAKLNAIYLFFRCPTGRRLKAAFGEDVCHSIIWEEASPLIAAKADGVFPPDREHMVRVILHFKPDLVLAFGKVAQDGMQMVRTTFGTSRDGDFTIINGPHPTARHATVASELQGIAKTVKELVKA